MRSQPTIHQAKYQKNVPLSVNATVKGGRDTAMPKLKSQLIDVTRPIPGELPVSAYL